MFVLNCLFELIFESKTKKTEQNAAVLNNRFADSNIPWCRVHKMGRPITIHRQPLYYCICVCRMYYMYLCLFTVSTVSNTVQVYFANTNKHTEQTGREKKKHTTEKELLEKHFHTMCDFPILSSMSGLFMYMCSVYTEAKIHETNRIFHLVRSFSYSLLPLCCFFSTLSLFLPLTLIRTDMQCHPMVVCVCWFHFDRNDSNEKWKPLWELDVSATVAFGVYSVFFFVLSGSSFPD